MDKPHPTQEEGLGVLVHKPADWPDHLPWESFLDTLEPPRDGWGNEFVYVLNSDWPEGFGIYSCGQDGITSSDGNDRDDLNTWNAQAPWNEYYRAQIEKKETISKVISSAVTLATLVVIIATASVLLWKAGQEAHQ